MTTSDKRRLLERIHYYYRDRADAYLPSDLLFLRRGGYIQVSACGGVWITGKGGSWLRANS